MKILLAALPKLILSLVFWLCLGIAGVAQQTGTPKPAPTPPPKPDETVVEDEGDVVRVTSTLVVVPVSVTDANGQPMQGLTKNDFRLEEEGRGQELEQIGTAEQVPLEIAVLIDASGSVNPIFELEKAAAARFLQTVMKPDDRATIFLIGAKPTLVQERDTAEKTAVRVKTVAAQLQQTAFYDTVTAATNYLRQNAPERSRRVILALTDGEDNWSDSTQKAEVAAYRGVNVDRLDAKERERIKNRQTQSHLQAQAEVLRNLQNADTVFYVINPAGNSIRLNPASLRAQTAMQRFAGETGGTAFVPKLVTQRDTAGFQQRNAEVLERIFQQISAELRAQYLLQYYSQTDFPAGKYVKLKVDLTNKPALKIRARQGYFAKNQ